MSSINATASLLSRRYFGICLLISMYWSCKSKLFEPVSYRIIIISLIGKYLCCFSLHSPEMTKYMWLLSHSHQWSPILLFQSSKAHCKINDCFYCQPLCLWCHLQCLDPFLFWCLLKFLDSSLKSYLLNPLFLLCPSLCFFSDPSWQNCSLFDTKMIPCPWCNSCMLTLQKISFQLHPVVLFLTSCLFWLGGICSWFLCRHYTLASKTNHTATSNIQKKDSQHIQKCWSLSPLYNYKPSHPLQQDYWSHDCIIHDMMVRM